MGWLSDLYDIVDNTASIVTVPVKTITKTVKETVEDICDDDDD